MGFTGLVVSDSMNMHSMKRNYAPAEAAIQAFQAGVDLMMLAEEHYDHDASQYLANQRALIGEVIAAVKDGRIAMSRVDEAVERILHLKRQRASPRKRCPKQAWSAVGASRPKSGKSPGAPSASSATVRACCRSSPPAPLTLVNTTLRSAYDVLTKTRASPPTRLFAAFDVFAEAMQAACRMRALWLRKRLTGTDLPAAGVIIAVTENYTLPGMDFDRSRQAQIVRALHESAGARLLVLALCEPYQLADFLQIDGYVCAYSFRPARRWRRRCLAGRAQATGTTPVSVPGTELARLIYHERAAVRTMPSERLVTEIEAQPSRRTRLRAILFLLAALLMARVLMVAMTWFVVGSAPRSLPIAVVDGVLVREFVALPGR